MDCRIQPLMSSWRTLHHPSMASSSRWDRAASLQFHKLPKLLARTAPVNCCEPCSKPKVSSLIFATANSCPTYSISLRSQTNLLPLRSIRLLRRSGSITASPHPSISIPASITQPLKSNPEYTFLAIPPLSTSRSRFCWTNRHVCLASPLHSLLRIKHKSAPPPRTTQPRILKSSSSISVQTSKQEYGFPNPSLPTRPPLLPRFLPIAMIQTPLTPARNTVS